MEVQHAVAECKDLISRLRELTTRILVEGSTELRPMHKLVLSIRMRMREIQHKIESLKEVCIKARDHTDELTLEVEKVNYLREAYRVSIEQAERQPTPELSRMHIDPSQSSEFILDALQREQAVSANQARKELLKQLEEEQSSLEAARTRREQLTEKMRKFREMASKVAETAGALKTWTDEEFRTED